ncbi:hypothetical protein M501DRAFT_1028331 [Patellaria atrata CBS 101060]|uniref:Uncharacterized protein n=1 Tax=Patellaria atrata CBS 101060 TaxID=1346257 RepID=A0A9P4SJR5_9PEZI|nr:hypothetical protein M501DRAFT_1028331 [Patellaria atrata CBS 101060]
MGVPIALLRAIFTSKGKTVRVTKVEICRVDAHGIIFPPLRGGHGTSAALNLGPEIWGLFAPSGNRPRGCRDMPSGNDHWATPGDVIEPMERTKKIAGVAAISTVPRNSYLDSNFTKRDLVARLSGFEVTLQSTRDSSDGEHSTWRKFEEGESEKEGRTVEEEEHLSHERTDDNRKLINYIFISIFICTYLIPNNTPNDEAW